jgi:hypothetical protein
MESNYKNPALHRYAKSFESRTDWPGRGEPPIKINEKLLLADGRVFDTRNLLKQVTHSESITLTVKGQPPKVRKERRPTAGAPAKYSDEDRLWMAHASPEQVQARYPVTRHYAKMMIKNAQKRFGLV